MDTGQFFSNESHEKILKKSDSLTRLIKNEINFKDGFNLDNTLSDSFIYYSRFYLNNILWLIEILINIKNKYNNLEFFLFYTNKESLILNHYDPHFLKNDSFVKPILKEFCKTYNIPCNTAHLLRSNHHRQHPP